MSEICQRLNVTIPTAKSRLRRARVLVREYLLGSDAASRCIARERTQMAKNSQVAYAQTRLNDARRALHDTVDDFSIPDETVLELRDNARRAFDELKALDRKVAKGGFRLSQILVMGAALAPKRPQSDLAGRRDVRSQVLSQILYVDERGAQELRGYAASA